MNNPTETVLKFYGKQKGWGLCKPQRSEHTEVWTFYNKSAHNDFHNKVRDLQFCISLLEMKKDVDCSECKGAGNHIVLGLNQGSSIFCEPCKGTGKIEVYVIDWDTYLDTLLHIQGYPSMHDDSVKDSDVAKIVISAIHNVPVKICIEAMAAVIKVMI